MNTPNYFDTLNPELKLVPEPDYNIELPKNSVPYTSIYNNEGTNIDYTPDQKAHAYFDNLSKEDPFKPYNFDWDATNADRYVKSQYLHSVGFKPDAGPLNELNYYEAQPWYKAVHNTFTRGAANLWNGFADMAMSWKDTFQALSGLAQGHGLGNAFQADELEQVNKKALEFDNQYPIFQSDPSGQSINWRSFLKTASELPKLPGAIIEMGVEDIAMTALTAGSGGATAGGAIARVVTQGVKLGKLLDNAGNMRKSYEAFKQSHIVLNAFELLKNSTKQAVTSLGSGLPGIGNTTNFLLEGGRGSIVKTALNGFHSVYSDMRDMNLAISMAQGNAAGVYQSLIQEESDKFKQRNGRDPYGYELDTIKDNAQTAAKSDGTMNAVAALLLNKLSFHNILTPSRAIQDAIADQGLGEMNKVGVNYFAKAGEDKIYLKTKGWGQFKKSILSGEVPLSMASHGTAFGTQMVAMSTIDKVNKDYYNALYNHENLSWGDDIKKNIHDLITPENAKTFISGFITGAIMGPIGEHIMPEAIRRGKELKDIYSGVDAKSRESEKVSKDEEASSFITKFNNVLKDPLSQQTIDAIMQKHFADALVGNYVDRNKKISEDVRGDATTFFLARATKEGLLDIYTNHLNDYVKELTPEELFAKVYGKNEPFDQQKHNEFLRNLNEFQGKAKDSARVYKDIMRKFPNPFNPYRFKDGTPEREAEKAHFDNYRESVTVATYLKNLSMNHLERMNKILNDNGVSKGLNNLESFKNIPYTTILSLTTLDRASEQLGSLSKDIQAMRESGGTSTPEYKELNDHFNILTKYQDHLINYAKEYLEAQKIEDVNKSVQETINVRKKYKDDFSKSLEILINSQLKQQHKETISTDELDRAVNKLMDYYELSIDSHQINNYVNTILDPTGWGYHISSSRHAFENVRKAEEERKFTTPPKENEPDKKDINGNLHGWNPNTKRWESIQKDDVYNSEKGTWGKKEKEKAKEEDKSVSEKEHIERQKQNLKNHLEKTEKVLRDYKENEQRVEDKLTEYNNELEKVKSHLITLLSKDKFSVDDFNKTSEKLTNLEKTIKESLEILKQQKDDLTTVVDTIKEHDTYSKKYEDNVQDLNVEYSKIQGELKNLNIAKEEFRKLYDESKDKINLLDNLIDNYKNFAKVISSGLDNFKFLQTLFEKLHDKKGNLKVKSKQEYLDILKKEHKFVENKIKTIKSLGDVDEEVLQSFEDRLKTVKIFLKELNTSDNFGVLTKDIRDGIEAIFDKIEEESKLKDLDLKLKSIDENIINYTKQLNENLGEQEKASLLPQKPFPEDSSIPEHSIDEEPTTETPKDFKPEIRYNELQHRSVSKHGFAKTQQRVLEPEHFSIIGTIGGKTYRRDNPLQIKISWNKEEGKVSTPYISGILDPTKYEEKDIQDIIKSPVLRGFISNHFNNGGDLKDLTNITDKDSGTDIALKYYLNDEILHNTKDSVRWNNSIAEMVVVPGKHSLKIVTSDNDNYGIIRADINPNDIKAILVNSDGIPIDKNSNIISKPDKDNIVYTSLPSEKNIKDKHTLLSGNLRDPEDTAVLHQVNDVKKVLDGNKGDTYSTANFNHKLQPGEDLENYLKNFKQKLVEYRSFVADIKEKIKDNNIFVVAKNKITGFVKTEKFEKSLPDKGNLLGRLVVKSDNYDLNLKHPNGQHISSMVWDKGKMRLKTEDGTEYPVYSRIINDEEKDYLKKAFVRLTELLKNITSLNPSEKLEKNNLEYFIGSLLYLRRMTTENLKDPDKLGKNRFSLSSHEIKVTSTDEETGGIKIDSFNFRENDETSLKVFLDKILENRFLNVDQKQWNENKKYEVNINGKNLEIAKDYRTFVLEKVLNSNVIEYGSKDENGNQIPQVINTGIYYNTKLYTIESKIEESSQSTPEKITEDKNLSVLDKVSNLHDGTYMIDEYIKGKDVDNNPEYRSIDNQLSDLSKQIDENNIEKDIVKEEATSKSEELSKKVLDENSKSKLNKLKNNTKKNRQDKLGETDC